MTKSPCNGHDPSWTPEEEEAFTNILAEEWDNIPDVPDVDIEYQEDDGNSSCDGGACTI